MAQRDQRHAKQIVGDNLRRAREARGLTQRQVGEAVGAAGPDVSRWENGRIEPGMFYRVALANLLFEGDVSALYRDLEEVRAA